MSNHVAFGLLSVAPLTSQLRSVAGLVAERMPNNIAFNVKVVPGATDSHDEVVSRMSAYAAAYFELGGMQLQFNVTSSETLHDAMKTPEAYRDLLVRISGYNAYFVELNQDIQLELIERMEHHLDGAGR